MSQHVSQNLTPNVQIFALTMVLVVSLGMGGCGFHLRGKVPLSPQLSPLVMQGEDRELMRELRKAVDFNGLPVATDEASANAVLRVAKAEYGRRVRTTDDRGLATSYTLIYVVRVDVEDTDGEKLTESFRISTRRDLSFDRNRVLQSEERERVLREDMQRELAQSILRRLAKIS